MTEKSPLRVYLFRHGETEWSLSGQHTGTTELSLTPHGEVEARNLGAQLKGIEFSHVFTSPRIRARQTYELTGIDVPAITDEGLAEWNYGDYEGITSKEIHKTRPHWNVFKDGCPNGESPAEIGARADQFLARIRDLEGNVALFSHGQMGAVIAARWIDVDVSHAQHLPLATASISILGFAIHHPDVPVIALWNAASETLPAM